MHLTLRGVKMVIHQLVDIDELVQLGRERARKTDHPIIVSQVLPVPSLDPLSFYVAGRSLFQGKRFYWSSPNQGQVLVGLGSALEIEGEKESRFYDIHLHWTQLKEYTILGSDMKASGTGPLLLGGFSFVDQVNDPLWKEFKPASFTLPQLLLSKKGSQTFLTINLYLDPQKREEPLPFYSQKWCHQFIENVQKISWKPKHGGELSYEADDQAEWKRRVNEAIKTIKENQLRKVVLARRLEVSTSNPIEPETVLANLVEMQKGSYIFAIEKNDHSFMGASPEQLVRKEGEVVLSSCLAGSIPRGKTVEEDQALSKILLGDQKNRHEHQVVVQMIKEALQHFCQHVTVVQEPIILKTAQIQHLYTPVKGKIKPSVSLLNLVQALHPTPALGGYPQEKAVNYIKTYEPFERGWYASPIGWLDHHNNGEFIVGIRSGLIKGRKAYLYAGCGIVEDSDPLAEYEETNIKFKPMLSALGGQFL